jgi:hypothetical protein
VLVASGLPEGEYFPVVTFYNEYQKVIGLVDLTGRCRPAPRPSLQSSAALHRLPCRRER